MRTDPTQKTTNGHRTTQLRLLIYLEPTEPTGNVNGTDVGSEQLST